MTRQAISVVARRRGDRGPTSAKSLGVGRAMLIGGMALGFSALYFLSDLIEVVQGGFSVPQLWATLVAEGAIPVFVVGLSAVQQPRLGRVGLLGALAYAYTYLVFTGTVVYALVNRTEDYASLSDELGTVIVLHGAVMVLAGIAFGYAVLRAGLLPAWTARALMIGVVGVALAQALPDGVLLTAAGIRDLGFAGMGIAVLRNALSPVKGSSR
jgi:hypothetical protein